MFSYLCCRCGQVQVPPCDAKTNIFSSEYSGSECLLPASITFVADTVATGHTHEGQVTLVTTRWRGCHSDWYAQRPRSILSRHPAEILFMPPLSSDSGSRVYPNLGTK